MQWLRNRQYQFALAAIILYNNWILAVVLNYHATFAGATTSELEVKGQPWSALFQVMEIIAGFLFVLGAKQIAKLGRNTTQHKILYFGMCVLGISTIIEALLPLSCAGAIDSACGGSHLHLLNWQDSFHVFESIMSYLLIFLLPLGGFLASRALNTRLRLKQASLILMAFMIVWLTETVFRYIQHAESYGYEQRAFLILFTIWFVVALKETT